MPVLAKPASAVAATARLVSLDVFRGATMAAMVIVNNPGDWSHVYWPLEHAEWNGWTPTDLIFPFFLFIVGVSITLSRKSASWSSIARRAALIVAIGWFLAAYPHFDLAHLRLPGVLPRIGVCYLAAAALYKTTRGPRQSAVLMGTAAALCVGYWLFMTRVPTPAGVVGDLTPDGNWGAHVDRAVFGVNHLWSSSKTWDPEGILSTIPAIGTTLLGIAAGLLLAAEDAPTTKIRWLVTAGAAGIVIAYLWHPLFPINKKLWTSSFVALTAGAACLMLALCYWWIDVRGHRRGMKPLVILGTNAIMLYAASDLLVETLLWITVPGDAGERVSVWHLIFVKLFQPIPDPYIASLTFAVANLVVLFALLAWMYRRRIFLRV